VSNRRNLFFFCTQGKQTEDFRGVARRIRERVPDIAPFVFTTRAAFRPILASAGMIHRLTVSIEMDGRRERPRILRGTRLTHGEIGGKIEQYKRLEANGLPVPKWVEISAERALDPREWGPYVVVKPSHGKRGAYVLMQRTGRVRFRAAAELPEDHPARHGPMLAQRFIHTGPWPVSYRVLTYFGKVVLGCRYDGRRDLAPLESAEGLKQAGGGLSIVAPARGCTIGLSGEDDILDLARRAHQAFPATPSLGTDIVREMDTGKLYVLEVNPGGQSWFLTSDAGKEMQAEFGFDFYSQFGALDLIADRSIEIAREHAR
jgi:hypothetical protein